MMGQYIKKESLILNEKDILEFRKNCHLNSKKVVLATGVFDILHIGHLKFLEKAKEWGDILIVGVNDNAYVKKNKGEDRPIQDQYDRAYLVAGFGCVDRVHIYSNGNEFFEKLKPDILIMSAIGGKKPTDRKQHYEIIERNGGAVVVLDGCSIIHSSDLIEKIKKI